MKQILVGFNVPTLPRKHDPVFFKSHVLLLVDLGRPALAAHRQRELLDHLAHPVPTLHRRRVLDEVVHQQLAQVLLRRLLVEVEDGLRRGDVKGLREDGELLQRRAGAARAVGEELVACAIVSDAVALDSTRRA